MDFIENEMLHETEKGESTMELSLNAMVGIADAKSEVEGKNW